MRSPVGSSSNSSMGVMVCRVAPLGSLTQRNASASSSSAPSSSFSRTSSSSVRTRQTSRAPAPGTSSPMVAASGSPRIGSGVGKARRPSAKRDRPSTFSSALTLSTSARPSPSTSTTCRSTVFISAGKSTPVCRPCFVCLNSTRRAASESTATHVPAGRHHPRRRLQADGVHSCSRPGRSRDRAAQSDSVAVSAGASQR